MRTRVLSSLSSHTSKTGAKLGMRSILLLVMPILAIKLSRFDEADEKYTISKMIKFSSSGFCYFYRRFDQHTASDWKVPRDQKCSQKPMGIMFMSLVVLKHSGSLDSLGKVLRSALWTKVPTLSILFTSTRSSCIMRHHSG